MYAEIGIAAADGRTRYSKVDELGRNLVKFEHALVNLLRDVAKLGQRAPHLHLINAGQAVPDTPVIGDLFRVKFLSHLAIIILSDE
jgi:hypothetical protein